MTQSENTFTWCCTSAHPRTLLTVAEGTETTQQQEHVTSLGCDLAQGYLFSRPIDAEAVRALVGEQDWPEPALRVV